MQLVRPTLFDALSIRSLGVVAVMALGLGLSFPSHGQSPDATDEVSVVGIVYSDSNRNGRRDEGEPGIAGVAVSNGRDVVLTDQDGGYRLAINKVDGVIQITKPSGYALPLNELNLPQFYRLHKPAGSPRQFYEGIQPTGPLPESVDFALMPSEEPDRFRAVLFADTQVESSEEVRHFMRKVLGEAAEAGADFVVNLGDIMFDHLDFFTQYNRAMARLAVPIYSVMGNHDLNFDAENDADSDETYTALFGPANYSWRVGRAHFVALDTIQWNGRNARPSYNEILDERTLTWLGNDLSVVPNDALVVLCVHAPLAKFSTQTTAPRIGNFDRLVELLAGRDAVLAVSGHTHTAYRTVFGKSDGWDGPGTFEEMTCVTVSGSWWSGPRDYRGVPHSDQRDGVPPGYTLLDVDGTTYSLRYKAAGLPETHQMRIYPPGTHTAGGDLAPRRILANVFYGYDACRVECSVNGGPWVPMVRQAQIDPLAQAFYTGPVDSGKPFVDPVVTPHIWLVDLDEAPARGPNRYRVRVTWPDGRTDVESAFHSR